MLWWRAQDVCQSDAEGVAEVGANLGRFFRLLLVLESHEADCLAAACKWHLFFFSLRTSRASHACALSSGSGLASATRGAGRCPAGNGHALKQCIQTWPNVSFMRFDVCGGSRSWVLGGCSPPPPPHLQAQCSHASIGLGFRVVEFRAEAYVLKAHISASFRPWGGCLGFGV